MKQIFKRATIVLLLLNFMLSASAGILTGNCGTNVNWSLNTSTGVLDIYGTGPMTNYFFNNNPWKDHATVIKKVNIGEGITTIGNYAFYQDFENFASVSLPSSLNSVGDYAFYYCRKLSSITLSSNLESIGDHAFAFCQGLLEIDIPDGVISLGSSAFHYCDGLQSIYIPASVTNIGTGAFAFCQGLKTITVSEDNSNYDSRDNCNAIIETATNTLIAGCNTTIIPQGIKKIGDCAFYGNLGRFQIPIVSVSIDIPEGVEEIGYQALSECYLTSLNLPNSLKVIGKRAFYSNRFSSVVIPESVTIIKERAFSNCTYMTEIVLPSTVTNIESGAFYGCKNLTKLTCLAKTPPAVASDAFDQYSGSPVYSTCDLYVGKSKLSSYNSAYIWRSFKTRNGITIPTSSIQISTPSTTAEIGTEVSLSAILSEDASEVLFWKSSDEKIATVCNGKVIGAQKGDVTISAKTTDGTNLSADCHITFVASENTMTPGSIKAKKNSTALLPIYMSNDVTIANTQCDLYLPKGMSVKFDEDEEAYLITKGERLKTAHSISCKKQTDGAFRIMITSLSNATIKDTDKSLPVMYVPVEIGTGVALGSHDVLLKNIIITHYDSETGTTTPYNTDEMNSMIILPQYYNVVVGCNDNTFGSVNIESDTYDGNENIAETGDELKLTATPNTDYRFAHWTVNGTWQTANPLTLIANESKNIQAVFEKNTYTVTFKVDGATYSSSKQFAGHILETPTQNPTKAGYTFTGWEGVTKGTAVPTNDVTYNALFSINQYLVTFVANGRNVYSQKQDYQSPIIIPTAPTKDQYVFITWGDVEETVPAHDITYTAEYALLGDVYEDHTINVADLTSLVDIILTSSNKTSERLLKIADVYTDNQINVADYTSLVALILNSPSNAKAIFTPYKPYSEPKLNAWYENNMVNLVVKNASNMTALQFDIVLPEGYNVSDITLNGFGNHNAYYRSNEDGTVRVMICSTTNELIDEQNNIVFGLKPKDTNASRFDELLITNIMGATCNSCLNINDVSISVGGNITGVEAYADNGLPIKVNNGIVRISSSINQAVKIVSINGMLLDSFVIGKDETKTLTLAKGTYIINGKKLIIN